MSVRSLVFIVGLIVISLFIPQTAFCQTKEKLGMVRYSPVSGWNTTSKENIVAFSHNQPNGTFCIITLYGATPSTGNLKGDFAREWNNLVLKNMNAGANPKTETQNADGWLIVAGGSEVDTDAGKALVFLSVISGFGNTVSVLAVFNDPTYLKTVDAFLASIDLDKPAEPAKTAITAGPMALDVDGHIIMPEPKAQFSIADLEGIWEEGGRISTSYVDRSSGAHAGTDSLAFKIKRTINSNGTYSSDFFEIRNGKTHRDITRGSITVSGRLLSVNEGNRTVKYVIRGLMETPTMTILRLAEGPWQNDDVIPQDRFTDFSDFSRFFTKTHWVRMK